MLDIDSSLRENALLFCILSCCPQWSMFPNKPERTQLSNSSLTSGKKSMSSVNSRWSNYLLSLHSFQSEHWAWLNEYNPLILFRSLMRKTRKRSNATGQMLGIRFDFFNCFVLVRQSPLFVSFISFNECTNAEMFVQGFCQREMQFIVLQEK